jgi:NADPH:quinone reductase-like Zn-dependent oxidoreductase
MAMRAVWITRHGGPEALEVRETADPEPGPGQVRVRVGRMWGQIATLREELQAVLALCDQGKVKPHIDRTYPFAEAAAAHRRILERRNIGKVLLRP